MSRLNTAKHALSTHEGGEGFLLSPLEQLQRTVMSCMLWENNFYEDGQSVADRIVEYASKVTLAELASTAIIARNTMHLRHVPLLLLSVLADKHRGSGDVAKAFPHIIQRADELAEFLAVFSNYKKKPIGDCITHGIRKGLAMAIHNFNAYNLAKYNRDGSFKLRDVIRLAHPKPLDQQENKLFNEILTDTLKSPDTWEVALSAGADKKETFERLLREGQLGYLALLRNLRGMANAGVDVVLINKAILARKDAERVLPFRYVAAWRAAPQFAYALNQAMLDALQDMPVWEGLTAILVDVSGSMDKALSAKSDLTRMDAAAALAILVPGKSVIYTFSASCVRVGAIHTRNDRGLAGIEPIIRSQGHAGTYLSQALDTLRRQGPFHRLVLITDEQATWGDYPTIARHSYCINVDVYQNGIGYGEGWVHINGWSEHVLRFITEHEKSLLTRR